MQETERWKNDEVFVLKEFMFFFNLCLIICFHLSLPHLIVIV